MLKMEKTDSFESLPSPLYHGGLGLHQGKWPAPDLSPVSDKILERQVDAEGRERVSGWQFSAPHAPLTYVSHTPRSGGSQPASESHVHTWNLSRALQEAK